MKRVEEVTMTNETATGVAMRRASAGEEGFSLIELMVVVFIMGLLATVVLVNVLGNVDKARTEKARVDVGALEQSLERFRLDNMTYPSIEQGLEALVTAPEGLQSPDRYPVDGYIKRLPLDPWGNPYQYVYPGERATIEVYSLGADGQPGGEGLDADIGNWDR